MAPYALFAATIPHAEYRRLFLLATLDLYSEFDEETKRQRTGHPPAELRARPAFVAIREKVLAAGETLSVSRKMDEASEAMEEIFVREQTRLALAGRAVDRPDAVASFLDRRSAKKGREPDAGRGMFLPAGFLEAIRLGFELSRGQLDESVSATRLSTPKLVGSGEPR